jgi:hypothetical protein
MEKSSISDDQQQDGEPRGKVARNTLYLSDKEMEQIPDSDDDYRLPRSLPGKENTEEKPYDAEEEDSLIDQQIDIPVEELHLLEDAEYDDSSDESITADMLDETDEDGDELNEGPAEHNRFDTGEDLDMPNSVVNPDIDANEEDQ